MHPNHWLVVWNILASFSIQLGIILPFDELTPSFFRGLASSTTNQLISHEIPMESITHPHRVDAQIHRLRRAELCMALVKDRFNGGLAGG